MQRRVAESTNHRYPSNRGLDAFREAVAGFYRDRFDTRIDPNDEVIPVLDEVPEGALERANLLFLNYPNNPTGAVVAAGFFERAVEFARRHGLIVVHDCSYSEIAFDGYRPPSFLETTGAKEVGVEIFSLSKGWNMTGWRVGWIAGNAEVVER